MIAPMPKAEIARIKRGQTLQAVVPVAAPGELKTGDQVTFQESDFDPHQTPTFVDQGESVTITLTKARSSGQPYAGSSMLFTIEWNAPSC